MGGPVFALVGLARAQAAAGMKVTVASAVAPGPLPTMADRLKQAGANVVPIVCSNAPFKSQPVIVDSLRPVIETADIVHIYGLWEEIQHQAAVLSRTFKKPHIFEPCGMLDPWALKRRWLKKKVYMMLRLRRDLDQATAIHASTAWERDQMESLNLRPPRVVVPAGVELGEFKELPPRGILRGKFPQLKDKPVMMFLGRIFPGKGLEMLIPAMAKMSQKQAMLAVVGPDSNGYEAKMRALAMQHGVTDRIVYTGMARGRERIEALVDADLFGLPSEHENFGVAVLEAMAAGIPVIVSDQVGLCNDIVSAQAGEAVPLDVDKLAKVLDRWIADEPLRRAAGQRARELAFSQFTWDLIIKQWSDAYKKLPA